MTDISVLPSFNPQPPSSGPPLKPAAPPGPNFSAQLKAAEASSPPEAPSPVTSPPGDVENIHDEVEPLPAEDAEEDQVSPDPVDNWHGAPLPPIPGGEVNAFLSAPPEVISAETPGATNESPPGAIEPFPFPDPSPEPAGDLFPSMPPDPSAGAGVVEYLDDTLGIEWKDAAPMPFPDPEQHKGAVSVDPAPEGEISSGTTPETLEYQTTSHAKGTQFEGAGPAPMPAPQPPTTSEPAPAGNISSKGDFIAHVENESPEDSGPGMGGNSIPPEEVPVATEKHRTASNAHLVEGVVAKEPAFTTGGESKPPEGAEPAPVGTGTLPVEVAAVTVKHQAASSAQSQGVGEPEQTHAIPQVSEAVVTLVKGKISSMSIQLNPPELGKIDLRVATEINGTHVTIVAENPATGMLLEQRLAELRQSMTEAGVNLQGVTIGYGQGGKPRADEQGWMRPYRSGSRTPGELYSDPSSSIEGFEGVRRVGDGLAMHVDYHI